MEKMTLRVLSTFYAEWVEDSTHEVADIDDLALLKAENIELRNALNEKNQILHSKENRIVELERDVMQLRGEVRYCQKEIYRLDAFKATQDIRIPKHSYNNFKQDQDGM
jgi:hypothetical protein